MLLYLRIGMWNCEVWKSVWPVCQLFSGDCWHWHAKFVVDEFSLSLSLLRWCVLPASRNLMECNLNPRLLCVGGEKWAWHAVFAHTHFPQDYWEFWKFPQSLSITLTSARHADFSHVRDACHWSHSDSNMEKDTRLEQGSHQLSSYHCTHNPLKAGHRTFDFM